MPKRNRKNNKRVLVQKLIDIMEMRKATDDLLMLIENTLKEGDATTAGEFQSQYDLMKERVFAVLEGVYFEMFTESDLRELVALYEKPIMKRFCKNRLKIAQRFHEKFTAILAGDQQILDS